MPSAVKTEEFDGFYEKHDLRESYANLLRARFRFSTDVAAFFVPSLQTIDQKAARGGGAHLKAAEIEQFFGFSDVF